MLKSKYEFEEREALREGNYQEDSGYQAFTEVKNVIKYNRQSFIKVGESSLLIRAFAFHYSSVYFWLSLQWSVSPIRVLR